MPAYLICDIATTPIAGIETFVDDGTPPENYTKPESIAKWQAEYRAKCIDKAGLDPDLGRISAIGYQRTDHHRVTVQLCKTEDEERTALNELAGYVDATKGHYAALAGYNALKFDWPFLQRRALYLGVELNLKLTDRYKVPHLDIADRLTHRGMLSMKSLGFYVKRHGWTDLVKPLSGAEEAHAPQRGAWAELEASVIHDVTATFRLGRWARYF